MMKTMMDIYMHVTFPSLIEEEKTVLILKSCASLPAVSNYLSHVQRKVQLTKIALCLYFLVLKQTPTLDKIEV